MILTFKQQFILKIKDGSKIHTIRDDKKNRWRNGMKIHFRTPRFSKNNHQFKEGVCVSTQRILMTSESNDIIMISVGSKVLDTYEERLEFALNDGFGDWDSFFNWFYPLIQAAPDQTYKAKLIHWTDKRY